MTEEEATVTTSADPREGAAREGLARARWAVEHDDDCGSWPVTAPACCRTGRIINDFLVALDAQGLTVVGSGLEAAWTAVEAVLPDGWWLGGVQMMAGEWVATGWGPKVTNYRGVHGHGPTPTEALSALRAALAGATR